MMDKQNFIKTKWDARDWTEDMKRKWQKKMFELGCTWQDECAIVSELGANFYFISEGSRLAYSKGSHTFDAVTYKQCEYSDAFPETEQGQKHDH
ncbi:hypothetical protein [Salinivibrio kushneri]|uniref:hypothetical protein n=1 Tax=Salinivibrio kushneri TaxID=1908198 RepID=UPI00098995DD|nr:hypothetical protein [Salinivibrio kushneri]OOE71731.1 hypothetical protein BZG19_02125 [Salinivibrio kushneri]